MTTDAEKTEHILRLERDKLYRHTLRSFLRKLGLKSARGISVSFMGMNIRKPGVYTRVT